MSEKMSSRLCTKEAAQVSTVWNIDLQTGHPFSAEKKLWVLVMALFLVSFETDFEIKAF